MSAPITTLFPIAQLPACVAQCGVLYDVNGKCVPPATTTAAASEYTSCFCADSRLTAWSTTTTDLCKGNCAAATDLASIESWYSGFCGVQGAVATVTTTGSTTSGTSKSTSGSSASTSGGGGTWLSTHYNWVIFLVIVVLAIAGIWVGSWMWRKRYLAKKDRQYALGKGLARATESGRVAPANPSAASVHVPGAGVFTPAPLSAAGVYGSEKPKKEKKKWIVKERT